MLKERQKTILEATILEHLRTARPVASRELTHELKHKASPATIRNEMMRLDDLGYLEQPHISAGRVPTDKGYRFFVDNLLQDYELERKERQWVDEVFAINEQGEFLQEVTRAIAQISGIFAVGGLPEEHIFSKSGFAEVLEEPEFQARETMQKFSYLVDSVEEEVTAFIGDEIDFPETIFIGSENPMVEARSCAMLLSSWHHPRGFSGFLTMIGPTRTNYPKHKSLIKYLKSHGRKK
ncbi:MAG: hypothetical protein HYW89_00035 [Candidatus Sungiibacteriota bacterium]|uniref:Heat-inducible transcription repressor HrcA C-terminal domain-containing protein n=1 Tax=Candidatus Sungiibacteriota bacterium TaxID=2750080 RepID=A0A7T5UPX1_9BACT|nr:MAG: hypothetical protein HYW89_00035 [Candidatus Sungbacteria bacterium]